MSFRQKAFTLVELLVVIIIIGILAAVAIPQFGGSSNDAKLSSLKEDLRTMRSSIENYNVDHSNVYPGIVKTHRATAAGSPAAHSSTADAFLKQMTCYSDADGNTCAEKNASFPYGPYIKRAIPDNPLVATGVTASGVTVTTDTVRLSADSSPTTGWKMSNQTGEIIANSSDYASY